MTEQVRVVQYGRVERYAVLLKENGSPTTVEVDVIFEHGRPVRFALNHRTEIDTEQLRALFEVLKRIGFDLGGEEK